jgi:hypothetical protein
VAGKPFIVTEWCFCWINDAIAEGPMIGAACGLLQDWDAMIWFDFSGGDWASVIDNEFDIGNKPHVFSQWPAAALLFLRRDLPSLPRAITARVTAETLLAGRGLSDGFTPGDAFKARLATEVGATGDSPRPPAPENEPHSFHAPGFSWSARDGVLTVNTPRTVSMVGWAGGRAWHLGGVTLRPATPFCAITVSSLDGQPLARARHLLVTTAARAQNCGSLFNGGRASLKRRGHAPILLEPVRGTLSLPGPPRFTVWPLAENGRRRPPLRRHAGPIALGRPPALWYEVTR